jgi:hypothetical protein
MNRLATVVFCLAVSCAVVYAGSLAHPAVDRRGGAAECCRERDHRSAAAWKVAGDKFASQEMTTPTEAKPYFVKARPIVEEAMSPLDKRLTAAAAGTKTVAERCQRLQAACYQIQREIEP